MLVGRPCPRRKQAVTGLPVTPRPRSRAPRGLLALVVLLIAMAAGCAGEQPPGGGSTVDAVYADSDRDGKLETAPGEPFLERTDLAPTSPPVRQIALFAQISDTHVTDEESPARLPFLDRRGSPFTSTFRPQEALTGHVFAAAVESLNRLAPGAVIVTGDLIDNAQRNELDQALAVLRGGVVDPNSGRPGYAGVQSADNPDRSYYRPDVDAPRRPGLLADAQRPFRSPGLRAPWYPVVGNHDVLMQGELAPPKRVAEVALGSRLGVELDSSVSVPRGEGQLTPSLVDGLIERGFPGRTISVAPDAGRRPVAAAEVLGRLRRGSGHGGGGSRLDYAFDLGAQVRGIVLDAARRDRGARGTVSAAQRSWLRAELRRAERRRIVVFSHQPLASSSGGQEALALLDGDPRVIAAVSGHSHRNSVVPRRSEAGGYWLVSTASLVDFPQQARAFRLLETASGGVAIETWMVDHGTRGDRSLPGDDGRAGSLAGISRELAYLDAQGGHPRQSAGGRADRNVRLYLR